MSAKAISMSRLVDAEEWAMRQADAIADKHMPEASQEKRWELAADIAEALTRTKRLFELRNRPDDFSA
jgi:hypothetical protein